MGANNKDGANYIQLNSDYCFSQRIILHELFHSIGLSHEHQRPDRDFFVTINAWNLNISEGAQE